MKEATLRAFEERDTAKLVAMYEQFEPKGEFQGLPPLDTPGIRKWVRQLCEMKFEQFVVEVDGRIVGHTALCTGQKRNEAELAIFVHQDFRGLGLGKKLLLGTLNYGCKKLKLDHVWLLVQGSNPVAVHLFESAGFRCRGQEDSMQWELEMARPSNCAQCKGDRCIVFNQTFPETVRIPIRKSSKSIATS